MFKPRLLDVERFGKDCVQVSEQSCVHDPDLADWLRRRERIIDHLKQPLPGCHKPGVAQALQVLNDRIGEALILLLDRELPSGRP